MSFQMKNRYETGEEFYQDIKKHLIEDGFVAIKTGNETFVILSEESDEWYCHYQTCSVCNTDFMCSNAKFCPCCGRKIIARRQGNTLVYYGKGDEDAHCGFEESGGHAYNCTDCTNKCEEWYQWDKEFRAKGDEDESNDHIL